MEDSHALVQAYANLGSSNGGLEHIKRQLRWNDRRLYRAFLELREQATELKLRVTGEWDDTPPRLTALHIYPRDEKADRYPQIR